METACAEPNEHALVGAHQMPAAVLSHGGLHGHCIERPRVHANFPSHVTKQYQTNSFCKASGYAGPARTAATVQGVATIGRCASAKQRQRSVVLHGNIPRMKAAMNLTTQPNIGAGPLSHLLLVALLDSLELEPKLRASLSLDLLISV
jgi:hypothetical protein